MMEGVALGVLIIQAVCYVGDALLMGCGYIRIPNPRY